MCIRDSANGAQEFGLEAEVGKLHGILLVGEPSALSGCALVGGVDVVVDTATRGQVFNDFNR